MVINLINESLRDYVKEVYPQAIIFDNPSFDNSIIGFTDDGSICYNYDNMIKELMGDDHITYGEADEFIEYNTIRTIPYTQKYGVAPTIIYPYEE